MTDDNEQIKMDEAARWYYSEIMRQLMDSERFVNWFQCNFDVHKLIDEEEKSIEIRVLEVPPELVQDRMQQLVVEKMKEEQEKDSGIVIAQPDDLKQLEHAAKARKKRKKRR